MSGAVPAIARRTFPSATGGVLARGLVYTYLAGTSTVATTWQDIAMSVPNTNPILLDTTGSCTLWTDPSLTYKFVVQNAGGVLQYTLDNVLGSGQSPTLQQSHVDTLSGTGAQTTFTLSASPASTKDTNVYISGVYQEKSTYNVSGTLLTFNTPPASGTNNIEVTYYVLLDFTGLAATIAGYSAAAAASASDAQTSALAASTSETNAAGSVTAINNRIYPGTYTTAPTTRPDGSARQAGDEYFNATANLRYTYNGATWVASDINTANLAASSGSSLVGDGTTTVADRLSAINLASYTALRAYAGANQSAYITGYLASANPSGTAGLFTRDDSDTTSADNGGTIIVASNGKRWKRVVGTSVNLKWFGAKADGSDESATLTKLLNAAVAQAFAEIDLGGLTLTVANGCTLTNASGVIVKNGTLQGLLSNTTGSLLTLSGCTNVVVENVTFNAKNSLVSGQQLSGASVNNCSDVEFELCRFPDVFYGVLTTGTANHRIRLSRCWLVGPLAYSAPNAAAYLLAESLVFFFGPAFESGASQCYGELVSHLVLTDTTSSDIYAVDNVVKNSHDTAIYFYCPGALATGNKVYYAGKDGIKDNSTSGPGARFTSNYVYGSGVIKTDGGTCITSLGSEAVMSNNVIYLLPLASRAAATTVGIVSYNSNHVVDGNVITADSADTSNNGIVLGSSIAADVKNISISNNVLTGVYEAIKWGQPTTFTYSNVNISGNRIRDCARGVYGFMTDTGYTKVNQVTVVNNSFTNYSDSAIIMTLSSDVVVSGNRGYVVGGTGGKFFNNQGSHNVTFTNNTTDGSETTFLVDASSPTYLSKFGNMRGGTPQSPAPAGRAYTTAARPAANTVTQGAFIWNTTTNKPNWSDGTTNWYDAAGTIV